MLMTCSIRKEHAAALLEKEGTGWMKIPFERVPLEFGSINTNSWSQSGMMLPKMEVFVTVEGSSENKLKIHLSTVDCRLSQSQDRKTIDSRL